MKKKYSEYELELILISENFSETYYFATELSLKFLSLICMENFRFALRMREIIVLFSCAESNEVGDNGRWCYRPTNDEEPREKYREFKLEG